MVGRGLYQSGFLVWRLLAGVLTGVASTVAIHGAITFWTMHSAAPSGGLRGVVEVTLVVLVWAVASVGLGLLVGKVAGRLEVPVAAGSGLVGLIAVGYLPGSFADPVVLVFSAIPFLILVATGGMLAFFARRTDLR